MKKLFRSSLCKIEYKKIATEKLKFNVMTSSSGGTDHAKNEPKHCGTHLIFVLKIQKRQRKRLCTSHENKKLGNVSTQEHICLDNCYRF